MSLKRNIVWLLAIVLVSTLAAGTTWWCMQMNFVIEMRSFVAIFFGGIFFIFALILNTANKRRFAALDDLALVQSFLLSMQRMGYQHLPKKEHKHIDVWLTSLTAELQRMLHTTHARDHHVRLEAVDTQFDVVTQMIEKLRAADLPSPEISRVWQWHQQLLAAVERLRVVQHHRTPLALRVVINLMLVVALILLAPEFARAGMLGVVLSGVVSTIFIVLFRIQSDLENPFGDDIDDIDFRHLAQIPERTR